MSESKDKELSLDELKDASGGYNAGTNWLKKKSSFSELGKISLNSNDIKGKDGSNETVTTDPWDKRDEG